MEIEKNVGTGVHKMLVGNKCDLPEKRQISTEKAQTFADKYNIPYVETSAKVGTNVGSVFTEISSRILKDVKGKEGRKGDEAVTRINVSKAKTNDGCAC